MDVVADSLLDLQFRFARLLPKLLDKAHELGFDVTLGETWRSTATARLMAEQGKGVQHSLHGDRLAVDLNLFVKGDYQTDGDVHRPLGVWWEQQDPRCRWGGRFRDANHYSLTPDMHRA